MLFDWICSCPSVLVHELNQQDARSGVQISHCLQLQCKARNIGFRHPKTRPTKCRTFIIDKMITQDSFVRKPTNCHITSTNVNQKEPKYNYRGPSARIRINLKTQKYFYGYGFRPHVSAFSPTENG